MIDAWLEPPCEKPFRCKCRDRDCEGCDFEESFYDSYNRYLDNHPDGAELSHLLDCYIVNQIQLGSR